YDRITLSTTLLRLTFHVSARSSRVKHRLVLIGQRSDCRIGNFDILLNRAGAGADRAHDIAARHDRDTAAEYNDLARIAFLNTKKWPAGLCERRELGRGLVEESRSHRLVDREINAADESAILTYERHQMPPGVDNGDVVCYAEARSLCFGGRKHALCIGEGKRHVLFRHRVLRDSR